MAARPRPTVTPSAPSRDPLEWLAARLPLPLLLLAMPFLAAGLMVVSLCAGLRYRPLDTAFGLAVSGAWVWVMLSYLGVV